MPSTETEHHREDAVIQEHEDDGGSEAGDSEPDLVVRDQTVLLQEVLPHRARREQVEEVVARVERLDVPGVANLQPLRNVLGHRDGRQEPHGKQESGGHEHHHRHVVGLIARRHDGEELGESCPDSDEPERHPGLRVDRRDLAERKPAEQHRTRCNQDQVGPGEARQPPPGAIRFRLPLS